ncbi:MAG: prepilin-type N-terminal cleavage/methylation domain-containing protein [Thermoanaerobaculia bacterium]
MTKLSKRARGFTLVELLVVMAIIGILVGVAVPQLIKAPIKAKEAVLREDLFTFRTCIDTYFADKGKYPATLTVLVEEKYIRKMPLDPFTKSAETWQVEIEEPDSADTSSEQEAGVVDVHSGAPGVALDGTAYSSW